MPLVGQSEQPDHAPTGEGTAPFCVTLGIVVGWFFTAVYWEGLYGIGTDMMYDETNVSEYGPYPYIGITVGVAAGLIISLRSDWGIVGAAICLCLAHVLGFVLSLALAVFLATHYPGENWIAFMRVYYTLVLLWAVGLRFCTKLVEPPS